VSLVLKAAQAPGIGGKLYNAGNGNRYSLNHVWKVLQEIAGVSLPADYGPPRPGDVRHSQADITAAVCELGHTPGFSLEEGLEKTLEWQRRAFAAAS
jgi:UDP-glucose 4-epimerase